MASTDKLKFQHRFILPALDRKTRPHRKEVKVGTAFYDTKDEALVWWDGHQWQGARRKVG